MKLLLALGSAVTSCVVFACVQAPQDRPSGPPPVHPILQLLDENDDGELSKEEIDDAANVLRKLDLDGDGILVREELPRPPRPGDRNDHERSWSWLEDGTARYGPAIKNVMKILVIEDDSDLRSGLIQALREDGYAVDASANGEDGLAKAKSWDYDAIVLDLMLPVLPGLDVLRRLRSEKATPVLILTARDTLDDRVKGLDMGADDYLIKPFELQELTARLRAIIRRSVGDPSPIIAIGCISVDTSARRVCFDGEQVELTGREYRLVELLALHRGKLVTRTKIYDNLFDEDHDSMSNLVDVYISRLRSKLGKDLITTRRGEGYIIDVPGDVA